MSARVRSAILSAAALAACMIGATPAHAEFTAPEVLSARPGALASAASSAPAVSANGRYAVFFSAATNLYALGGGYPGFVPSGGGIFRADLVDGTLDLVVPTTATKVGATSLVPGRLAIERTASISADGRYVAFTTSMSLSPNDAGTTPTNDIYRRDMNAPIERSDAFELVTAVDGASTALTYPRAQGPVLSPRSMSDDGQRVAFSISGTLSPGSPAPAAPTVAPGQIFVRDIPTRRTIRLSATLAAPHGPAPNINANPNYASLQLSADGSVVAWNSTDVGAQVALRDTTTASGQSQLLWKRVDDATAPTARLAFGTSDPDDPACGPGGQPTTDLEPTACDGNVIAGGNRGRANGLVLGMNRDGSRLLVAANPIRELTLVGDSAFFDVSDLYLVDMAAGVSRKLAARRVTAGADGRSTSDVTGASLSPDGRWAAFTANTWTPAVRSIVPAGSFVVPSVQNAASLYAVDFERGTIEQLLGTYDGSGANGGFGAPTISEDGRTVVATAGASNLFYGDSNAVQDVVAFRRVIAPAEQPAITTVPPASAPVPLDDVPALRVSQRALPGGQVRLTIRTPGAGAVEASAVEAPLTRRAGKRAKANAKLSRKAQTAASSATTVTLDLTLLRKYAPRARRRGGYPAVVTVTFTPPGGAPTQVVLSARFARTLAPTPRTGQ